MISALLAASLSYWLPLTAVVISVASLLYSAINLKQQNKTDETDHLYDRIGDLEGQVESLQGQADRCQRKCRDLEKKCADLRGENLDLMRRLLKLEHP